MWGCLRVAGLIRHGECVRLPSAALGMAARMRELPPVFSLTPFKPKAGSVQAGGLENFPSSSS